TAVWIAEHGAKRDCVAAGSTSIHTDQHVVEPGGFIISLAVRGGLGAGVAGRVESVLGHVGPRTFVRRCEATRAQQVEGDACDWANCVLELDPACTRGVALGMA